MRIIYKSTVVNKKKQKESLRLSAKIKAPSKYINVIIVILLLFCKKKKKSKTIIIITIQQLY